MKQRSGVKRSARVRPAVFFDRDGTLIVDKNYLSKPEEVELIPGAAEAIRILRDVGYRVYVVSNQSGVARGYFSEASVRRVTSHLRALLAAQGARLDGFFHCPHHPQGTVARYRKDCRCRKPGPGMVEAAARRHPLDLRRSFIVGDKIDDLSTARAAGLAGGILVLTGYGKKSRKGIPRGTRAQVARDCLGRRGGSFGTRPFQRTSRRQRNQGGDMSESDPGNGTTLSAAWRI
jgi:D-glycero-D-manno-heptose 1,7-bisphosphate phosphatase